MKIYRTTAIFAAFIISCSMRGGLGGDVIAREFEGAQYSDRGRTHDARGGGRNSGGGRRSGADPKANGRSHSGRDGAPQERASNALDVKKNERAKNEAKKAEEEAAVNRRFEAAVKKYESRTFWQKFTESTSKVQEREDPGSTAAKLPEAFKTIYDIYLNHGKQPKKANENAEPKATKELRGRPSREKHISRHSL